MAGFFTDIKKNVRRIENTKKSFLNIGDFIWYYIIQSITEIKY